MVKQQQLRSGVDGQAPLPADLADGELALNFHENSPAVYLKDTAGNVRKVAGSGAVGTATDLGNTPGATTVEVSSSTGANTTLPAATASVAGVMTGADKAKLNGIAAGAEVNVQSDWNQTTGTADDFIKNKPTIPAAANDGQINVDAGTGLAVTGSNATANQAGNTTRTLSLDANLNNLNDCTVPSPNNGEFLSWDGAAWVNVPAPTVSGTNLGNTPAASTVEVSSSTGTDTTLPAATTSLAGVMAAADKTKLDGISAGAEVNVQSDWDETAPGSDAFIRNKPAIPAAPNDGAININAGTGLSATGSNATANQSGDTTRTLSLNAALNDLNNVTVPNPINGEFLSWDGTAWVNVAAPSGSTNLGNTPAASTVEVSSSTGTNTTLPAATTALAGVMTGADKTKLNGIAAGAEVNVQSDWDATVGDALILNKPTIPAAANNGQINVNAGTGLSASGTNGTANQSGNTTRTLSLDAALNDLNNVTVPTPSNGEFLSWDGAAWVNAAAPTGTTNLTYSSAVSSGTVNSSTGTNATIPGATSTIAGLLTAANKIKLDGIAPGAEVNVQSDWDATSGDAFILNKPTIPGPAGDGALTIRSFGQLTPATGTYTANQASGSTITLPQIRYSDLSGKPTIPSVNDGQINVNAGSGLAASGSNATANQSGNTTRTLSLNAALNNLTNCSASPSAGDVLQWSGTTWREGDTLDGGTF